MKKTFMNVMIHTPTLMGMCLNIKCTMLTYFPFLASLLVKSPNIRLRHFLKNVLKHINEITMFFHDNQDWIRPKVQCRPMWVNIFFPFF